jgi:hypothetical protein
LEEKESENIRVFNAGASLGSSFFLLETKFFLWLGVGEKSLFLLKFFFLGWVYTKKSCSSYQKNLFFGKSD